MLSYRDLAGDLTITSVSRFVSVAHSSTSSYLFSEVIRSYRVNKNILCMKGDD